MRTITYTYDETKPNNRDYVILALADEIDDGGASYESVAKYNIACPYIWDADCLNEREGNKFDTEEYNNACLRCKCAWLEREYDTYPHEDGKYEVEE